MSIQDARGVNKIQLAFFTLYLLVFAFLSLSSSLIIGCSGDSNKEDPICCDELLGVYLGSQRFNDALGPPPPCCKKVNLYFMILCDDGEEKYPRESISFCCAFLCLS